MSTQPDQTIRKSLRSLALFLLGISAPVAISQTPMPSKDQAPSASVEPLIADVHPSPYRSRYYYRTNISNQRFDIRDATLLDLISLAYQRENEAVLGGPTWIDFDHFDITAKIASLKPSTLTPAQASTQTQQNPYDLIRPMIKQVLTERLHLAYHVEERPLPGYLMTVAKEGSKLVEAKDPTAAGSCLYDRDKSTPAQTIMTCTSETMAQFLSSFGVFPHPVIDHTGLKKSYDFTLKLSFGQLRTREDYIRVYSDALRQELGLVVAAGDISQPAMIVEKADRIPTPNSTDIAKLIPVVPDLEFEVATIKPAAPTEPHNSNRFAGSQITFTSFSVQDLLAWAWQLPTGAMLGNAPTWLDHVRYTILVKLPPDLNGRAVFENQDLIDRMLQKLIVERFGFKYHWGEQTQDAYVLLAGTPKMRHADPASRSVCKFGPAPGEKDVTNSPDSPFDHQFYCQNVTMDQFADMAQSVAGSEVKNRVPNKTGLAGSYDITLHYTSGHKMRTDAIAAADAAKQSDDTSTVAPVAGETVEDAFRKQLGLRLERQPLTMPALIIDHIEQTPTDN